jgi:hypothetical protein
MGLPRSMTLPRGITRHSLREVLECGSPMPLSLLAHAHTPKLRSLAPCCSILEFRSAYVGGYFNCLSIQSNVFVHISFV